MTDRWHVTQEAWVPKMGMLYDEWVSIGKENYQNAGLWIHSEDARNAEINQRLLTNNLLDILREGEPASFGIYEYQALGYLLMQYNTPTSAKTCVGIPKDVEGCCEMQIWISLETGFLVKGAFLFDGKTPEGEVVRLEKYHMFASFNEDVRVNSPPWLNVERNSKGKLVIVNTEVPILEHHP